MRIKEFIADAKPILTTEGKYVLAIPYIFYDKDSRKWRQDDKYEEILL